LVSFSLSNPTRYSDNIVVPGYRCEKGGEVVVDITVNRSGDVVAAAVNKGLSDSDNCMHETALDAARRSRFNLDGSAPERQTGTITYLFIPQ
jgi:TonB family protein